MKHYGIPYMGSKEKILNLIHYIFEREHEKKYLIDPFCGGFSVSAYALEKGFKVLANDLNKYVIGLYREMLFNNSKEISKVWFDWVSRERFKDVKDNPDKYPDWYVGYVLTIWSFGNGQSAYLFGQDIEPIKQKLHQALVFDEWSEDLQWLNDIMPELPKKYSPQKRLKFMGVVKKSRKKRDAYSELEQLEQLERLQQLEQLEQLEQLQQLERLEQLESMDWYDFIKSIPKKILELAFIYCDPPYEDTAKYQANSMDYEQFWDWFRNCPYPVYVSSYKAPDDIEVLNFENKRELLAKKSVKKENIYFNGKGNYTPTMLDMLFNTASTY